MMKDKKIEKMFSKFDEEIKKHGLSRRDAFKLAGLSGAAFLLNPTTSTAQTAKAAANGANIVIAGGGAAGCSIASYLLNNLDNAKVTIIEPDPQSVRYQPGQTLVGAGVWTKADIMENSADFFPSDAKWIKDKVTEFNPESNKVKTQNNGEISYDFLVVATGIKLNYDLIDGLTQDMIGENGIASVYFADGAEKTWKLMQEFIEKAKNQKVNGVFTHPNTPIKCGGAPKKMQYLTHARLVEANARANAELTFYPNGNTMFGVKEYHDAIVKQYEARDMKFKYKHNLISIDKDAKKATFEHRYTVKGEYDKDLEEYEMIPKSENVVVDYDFIHVVPPMSASDAVKNSSLAWQKGSAAKGGWVELNKETLQHTRYANVFSLGDVAGIPMGKTGGSARKQYRVAGDNIISAINGKELAAKYDGYTVCPLITDIGTVMLAEFDWSGKPKPSFPLDPTVERWIWWVLKAYMLKPMQMYGMLSGRA